MKNGIEKQKLVFKIISEHLGPKDKKTISEIYEIVNPLFSVREYDKEREKIIIAKYTLTMSCFRFIMKRLIDEGKVKAVKKVLPSTGSKAPVYLISKKTTKTK